MIKITEKIEYWIECSHSIWFQWFKDRPDGYHEFIDVEDALLSALVIDDLINSGFQIDKNSFYEMIVCRYRISVINEKRIIMRRQKSSNLFGTSKLISIQAENEFSISAIDTSGNLLEGQPCVELIYNEKDLLLEPYKNLDYYLALPIKGKR